MHICIISICYEIVNTQMNLFSHASFKSFWSKKFELKTLTIQYVERKGRRDEAINYPQINNRTRFFLRLKIMIYYCPKSTHLRHLRDCSGILHFFSIYVTLLGAGGPSKCLAPISFFAPLSKRLIIHITRSLQKMTKDGGLARFD